MSTQSSPQAGRSDAHLRGGCWRCWHFRWRGRRRWRQRGVRGTERLRGTRRRSCRRCWRCLRDRCLRGRRRGGGWGRRRRRRRGLARRSWQLRVDVNSGAGLRGRWPRRRRRLLLARWRRRRRRGGRRRPRCVRLAQLQHLWAQPRGDLPRAHPGGVPHALPRWVLRIQTCPLTVCNSDLLFAVRWLSSSAAGLRK